MAFREKINVKRSMTEIWRQGFLKENFQKEFIKALLL